MNIIIDKYSTKALEEISKEAWDCEDDMLMTIKCPWDGNPGTVSAVRKKILKYMNKDFYDYVIDLSDFNSFEDLSDYIATTVIGG